MGRLGANLAINREFFSHLAKWRDEFKKSFEERTGVNSRLFSSWKIRLMRTNAITVKQRYLVNICQGLDRWPEELALPLPTCRSLRADLEAIGWAPSKTSRSDELPVGIRDYFDEFEERIRLAGSVIGRDERIANIAALWRDDDASRTYLLVATAGLGKTALMERLLHTYGDCLRHFIRGNVERRQPARCLKNLSAQIMRRFGLVRDNLPSDVGDLAVSLRALLREARGMANRRIVVVIDALDELDLVDTWHTTHPFAPLLIEPPLGCYFVVTSREDPFDDEHITKVELKWNDPEQIEAAEMYIDSVLGLGEYENQGNAEVLRRLKRSDPHSFKKELMAKCQFNFMYLRCVLGELAEQKDDVENPLDPHRLPKDLRSYYRNHWKRLWGRRKKQPGTLKVLITLAETGRPWPASYLAEVFGFDREEMITLLWHDWSMFLERGKDVHGEPVFTFYHETYRDFMQSDDEVESTKRTFGISTEGVIAELYEKLQLHIVKGTQ